MKYKITHPYLPYIADRILTGNYGETNRSVYCSACGEEITEDETYYDVDGKFFCMRCEDEAEICILDEVRNDYLYGL